MKRLKIIGRKKPTTVSVEISKPQPTQEQKIEVTAEIHRASMDEPSAIVQPNQNALIAELKDKIKQQKEETIKQINSIVENVISTPIATPLITPITTPLITPVTTASSTPVLMDEGCVKTSVQDNELSSLFKSIKTPTQTEIDDYVKIEIKTYHNRCLDAGEVGCFDITTEYDGDIVGIVPPTIYSNVIFCRQPMIFNVNHNKFTVRIENWLDKPVTFDLQYIVYF